MSRLTNRGANANKPAKLPGMQALRLEDKQTQQAIEKLREWVEVRLGSRGDEFERAVTMRELTQLLAPIKKRLDELGSFDGGIESLSSTESSGVPPNVRNGAFIGTADGRLFFGLNGAWREVTLAPA